MGLFVFGLVGYLLTRGKSRSAARAQRASEQAQARLAIESTGIQRARFERAVPGQRAQFESGLARRFGAAGGGAGGLPGRFRGEFEKRLEEDRRLAELGFNVGQQQALALRRAHSMQRQQERFEPFRLLAQDIGNLGALGDTFGGVK